MNTRKVIIISCIVAVLGGYVYSNSAVALGRMRTIHWFTGEDGIENGAAMLANKLNSAPALTKLASRPLTKKD